MRRISLSLVLAGLTGCAASTAQLQSVSSGQIGCKPDAIQVEEYKLGVTTSSWSATCDGSKYFCSGSDTLNGVSCAKGK